MVKGKRYYQQTFDAPSLRYAIISIVVVIITIVVVVIITIGVIIISVTRAYPLASLLV